MTETTVRRYRTRAAYEQDLLKLAPQGWIVASVSEQYPRLGCAALLLAPLRWRSLPPKPEIVVTYQREQPGPPS
jgi:hypothetical protein